MSPVLISPCIWKRTKIFHGDVCSSRPAVTFCKNMCLVACPSPSPKSHWHWPSPLPLQSAFSKLCEAVVLILPQIKLNSQLSHCVLFFSRLFFFFSVDYWFGWKALTSTISFMHCLCPYHFLHLAIKFPIIHQQLIRNYILAKWELPVTCALALDTISNSHNYQVNLIPGANLYSGVNVMA